MFFCLLALRQTLYVSMLSCVTAYWLCTCSCSVLTSDYSYIIIIIISMIN